MRDILFRGKRVDNGEWETGSLVITRSGCSDEQVFLTDKMTGYLTPVIPETVGQYIGIVDENGKKIFEGDIVITNTTSYEFIGCIAHSAKYVSFVCVTSHNIPYSIDSRFKYEIIGNIFDNPELLKNNNLEEHKNG